MTETTKNSYEWELQGIYEKVYSRYGFVYPLTEEEKAVQLSFSSTYKNWLKNLEQAEE